MGSKPPSDRFKKNWQVQFWFQYFKGFRSFPIDFAGDHFNSDAALPAILVFLTLCDKPDRLVHSLLCPRGIEGRVKSCTIHVYVFFIIGWMCNEVKRLKVWTFIYRRLQGNQNSSGLQFKVGCVLTGNDTRWRSASIAAAHCPNQWTLDPAVCSYNRPTYAPASRTNCYSFAYPRGMEGWVGLSTMSVNNSLYVTLW